MTEDATPVGRRVLAILLLLAVASCSRDCGCVSGEKTYETLDGKVKVELVRSTRWSGNHLVAAPSSHFFLRIHTDPPFTQGVGCSHVDLAEDDAGRLIAFRCRDTKPWHILRLRGGARHLLECEAPVGQDDEPDFAALPPLRDSVKRILECARRGLGTQGETWPELIRSVTEEQGADAAVQLAIRMCDEPGSEHGGDPWPETFKALAESDQARVLLAVCGKLADLATPDLVYQRLAGSCPRTGERVVDAALVRLGDALGSARQLPWARQWAAAIAIQGAPQRAGETACASLKERGPPKDAQDLAAAYALAAIALSETRCEAVGPWLEPPPCGWVLDCEGHLCTQAELAAELQAWRRDLLKPDEDGEVRPAPPRELDRLLLAAAYALGELPQPLLILNARRHYERPAEGPSCAEPLARGTPCRCDFKPDAWSREPDFCRIPLSQQEGKARLCTFRLDDAARRIVDVRSFCYSEGEPASYGAVCCPGLRYTGRYGCVPSDAGTADAGAADAGAADAGAADAGIGTAAAGTSSTTGSAQPSASRGR